MLPLNPFVLWTCNRPSAETISQQLLESRSWSAARQHVFLVDFTKLSSLWSTYTCYGCCLDRETSSCFASCCFHLWSLSVSHAALVSFTRRIITLHFAHCVRPAARKLQLTRLFISLWCHELLLSGRMKPVTGLYEGRERSRRPLGKTSDVTWHWIFWGLFWGNLCKRGFKSVAWKTVRIHFWSTLN